MLTWLILAGLFTVAVMGISMIFAGLVWLAYRITRSLVYKIMDIKDDE